MYSQPATVTQMVTALYAKPKSSLVTILKELAKAKQSTIKKEYSAHITKANSYTTCSN